MRRSWPRQPVLVDTVPAKEVIPEMADGKVLLHAGPPITYEHMPDPMKGSCIGAILFEEWADTEAEARTMLEKGEIRFIPCHHVHAVGRWAALPHRRCLCSWSKIKPTEIAHTAR